MTVSNFTELGLVEMTRKRTRESLAHVLCEPCPMCGGRGEVRTARTVCYSIMREIVRLCKQYQETKEFHIQASQTVIDMLLEEGMNIKVCLLPCRSSSKSLCILRWSRATPRNSLT